MNITYKIISKFYDIVLGFYFTKRGINPRNAILNIIPDKKIKLLDMCCGTMTEGIAIAKAKKNADILGVDISPDMLKIAKEKIAKEHISNAEIRQYDATNTGLESEKFDCVIISLVLHEIDTPLAKAMLNEAYRLLKSNGRLIVLEWERSDKISKRIKFLPIKLLEPKPFKTFFTLDKEKYFSENNFKVINKIHCDYTCVFVAEKIL